MLPARDIMHFAFRTSLEKAGWTIRQDPLFVPGQGMNIYIDLTAERPGEPLSAFEVKSLARDSAVLDFRDSLGQFLLYQSVLRRRGLGHLLFLAVPAGEYRRVFGSRLARAVSREYGLRFALFDPEREEIREWIK